MNADDMRTARHEAAHAALAVLGGLDVLYMERGRRFGATWGKTSTAFRRDDTRSNRDRARALIIMNLGAGLEDPVRPRACEQDVHHVTSLLRLAEWTTDEALDAARRVTECPEYTALHARFWTLSSSALFVPGHLVMKAARREDVAP